MGDRLCWLVGGGLRNSPACAPKEIPRKPLAALFRPPGSASPKDGVTTRPS